MPYTEENLKGFTLQHLKNILYKIQAHKSALPDEDVKKGYNKDTLKEKREKLAKEAGRMDLIFDKQKYGEIIKKKDQEKYLINQIIAVEKSSFIGKYIDADKNLKFDYIRDVDEKKGMINPDTGHVTYPKRKKTKKEESGGMETKTAPATKPTEAAPSTEPTEPTEKPYPELPTTKTEEIKKGAGKKMIENYRKKKKELFDEDADHFDKMNYLISSSTGNSEYEIGEVTEAQQEMYSAIKRMNNTVNRQDKDQVNQLKGMMKTLAETIAARTSNDQYTPEKTSKMIEGLEGLKQLEKKVGGKEIDPIINRIIDKRDYKPPVGTQSQGSKEMFVKPEQKPLEPFGGLPSQNEVEAPYLLTKSDKEIGNVRSVGFVGAMDQLAKVEDVTMEPSERSKSLKRFTNFRWVQSVQNSDLGYASPFQRMDDIDDRRRFGKCFMHGNKMPKDADTQDELDKAKGFNTYSLVPSFDMHSRMQPATPLSFINSTSKFARKLTKDEMEPINQGKRNVNNVKNTLEFPTLLFNDDPLMRIKDKYKNNIVC
jgi:hypothetical protein